MNEDGTPVAAAPADDKPDYSSPNDLDFEMTPEQEQAFVNEQLGLTNEPEASDPDTQPASEEPAQPEPPKPADEPEPKEEPKPEPDKPQEVEPVQTDDLWIEVDKLVVDEEGNKSFEKVKLVYDPEDPGAFIPDDFAFKSDKQLADILEAKVEMASLYKQRTEEFEANKSAQEAVKTAEQQEADKIASWDAEVKDLIDAGVLDEPKVKQGEPGFMEDPTVQKLDAVFKYMAAQNEERTKEGKAPIQSFGTAFSMYERDEAVKAEEEAQNKDNENAKKAGALVGGSSAAATGTDKPYVAGSASNIWEVPVE